MNSIIPMQNIEVDYSDLVQSDRVHTSLYKEEHIFEQEMEKIYYSTWVWVAHASEIPEGGSYKTINIGQQPVVVVRDRKKKVLRLMAHYAVYLHPKVMENVSTSLNSHW